MSFLEGYVSELRMAIKMVEFLLYLLYPKYSKGFTEFVMSIYLHKFTWVEVWFHLFGS